MEIRFAFPIMKKPLRNTDSAIMGVRSVFIMSGFYEGLHNKSFYNFDSYPLRIWIKNKYGN